MQRITQHTRLLRGLKSATRGFGTSSFRGSGATANVEAMVDIQELLRNPSPHNNVPETVAAKVGRNLHRQKGHPLNTIKEMIEGVFREREGDRFVFEDSRSPIVTTQQCFDELLVPADHVSRQPSDTFYIDETRLLRTHTTAHQTELFREGKMAWLCSGDVYRRDAVDATHYPVFHQMDAAKVYTPDEIPASMSDKAAEEFVVSNLKDTLEHVARTLFGDVEMRWLGENFPFTNPSLELEVKFQGDWLEVLGCGKIQQRILQNVGLQDRHGYAFGLGLERLAMILFDIPDVRLFWTDDERFHKQFQPGVVTKFKPYSKYPPVYKDISFWVPGGFHENDFYATVRNIAEDLVENVSLIDEFTHPKTGRSSHCYRITYRSMDRSLTDDEIDVLQFKVREEASGKLKVELR